MKQAVMPNENATIIEPSWVCSILYVVENNSIPVLFVLVVIEEVLGISPMTGTLKSAIRIIHKNLHPESV